LATDSRDDTTARERGRLRPLHDPVTITLDGKALLAERGEPLCAAFVASGDMTIARSPKFHRPRGPSCLRGACDGCLARVDGAPNVMTCLVPAAEGTEVVSQNRLGPREADVLRMTDWFFPDGMNHHELFAGVPGIQSVMQAFARKVAGLGKLPSEAEPARPATRRRVEVVVVGAGPAGMAVAARLAKAGRRVEIIEDQLEAGGGLSALGPIEARAFAPIVSAFRAAEAAGAVVVRTRTTAGGLYGKDLLVVGPDGAEILEATAIVLACGAHDGAVAFEGNDVPGVMSARAAGWLLARGVLVGRSVVVVVPPGGGPFGVSYARALEQACETAGLTGEERPGIEVVHGEPVRVKGASRVKAVVVHTAEGERTLDADAVLIDAARAPAYELCEQAGAELMHEPRGYVVRADASGRVTDGMFAAGEVRGVPLDARAIEADADRVAAAVLALG
jgi:sarcosine oxidase subunit alpha